MSVFLGKLRPEYSPNVGFLREVDLKKASNKEITTAVQNRLPKDIKYSIYCDNNKLLSFPHSGGTMSLRGKEVVLYCSRPKKFLLLIPTFFSGICSPLDEEKLSGCSSTLIEQAFTNTAHDYLEEVTEEQREKARQEVKKAHKQALTIRFQISNSREFFDMKLGNTSVLKESYLKGIAIRMGVAPIFAKKKVDISKVFPEAEYLAMLSKGLMHLQAMLGKELTIAEEKMYRDRLSTCENKFSQQMYLVVAELGKEKELTRLKDAADSLTRTEFIKKQLHLVHESIVLLLAQDVEYLTTLSEEHIHLQAMPTRELTIKEEAIRNSRLSICENKFSQQMYLVVAELGKEKELERLRDTANNLTRTEFVKKQLNLVHESLDLLLVQDIESTKSIPLVEEHRHASENTQARPTTKLHFVNERADLSQNSGPTKPPPLVGEHRYLFETKHEACSATQPHLVNKNSDSPQSSKAPKAPSRIDERLRFFETERAARSTIPIPKDKSPSPHSFSNPTTTKAPRLPSQQSSFNSDGVNSRLRSDHVYQKGFAKPNSSLDTLLSDLDTLFSGLEPEKPNFVEPPTKRVRPLPIPPTAKIQILQ